MKRRRNSGLVMDTCINSYSIMTQPTSIPTNTHNLDVRAILTRHGISDLPIVRGKTLVEIITKSNIVHVISSQEKKSKKQRS